MTKYEGWGFFIISLLLVLLIVISSNPVVYDASNPKDSAGNINVSLHDIDGNSIGSLNGALNIHDADVHNSLLNLHAKLDNGTNETFGINGVNEGNNSFNVSSGNGGTFSVGDRVIIYENLTFETDIYRIISIVGDTLTVNKPLENNYTSAGIIEITEFDLSTALGTLESPVIFSVEPPINEIWHINTIILHIVDTPEPTIEKFGGITALPNGFVVRQDDGTIRNLLAIRTNGDMKEYFGSTQVEFIQKSGGGDWATNSIWHFKDNTGAIIRLDGTTNDTLQFIIQDDLTSLTEFEVIIQGHKEGE